MRITQIPKIPRNFTISESSLLWLQKQSPENLSEYVDKLILKDMQNQENIFERLKRLEQEDIEINSELDYVIEQIKEIKYKGNLEERKQAQIALDFAKAKKQEKKDKLKAKFKLIKNSLLWPEFQKDIGNRNFNLHDWAEKFWRNGIAVGTSDIKRLQDEGLLKGRKQ